MVTIAKTGEPGTFLTEHELSVFDCANPVRSGGRCIAAMAHVKMVAAVQPFLSGAASKTINLPHNATIVDVANVYREAHRLGIKAVALYRDGSKLSQPLSSARPAAESQVVQLESVMRSGDFPIGISRVPLDAGSLLRRSEREFLPWRRENGYTQKVKISEQSVFLTVNRFPDGRPGEMYLELAHAGSTLRAMADLWSMSVSIGLQYGVPAREYVERFLNTKFEPAGFVEGHERIKQVLSVGDYVARELGITFLGMDELGQVVPAVAVDTDERVVALDKRAVGIATGYSGDVCFNCGNATMVRTGTCLRCDTCHADTGCG
jgi:ribonucleoside-diphosphate reductase alpha chain